MLKGWPERKFDETVEVHFNLGLNVRHADQQLRGTLMLPHGTGRDVRVAVFAEGDKAKEAQDAGADVVGSADLAKQIDEGRPYSSVTDVITRCGLTKTHAEALATAGAFECFEPSRRKTLWTAGAAAASGQGKLAGMIVGDGYHYSLPILCLLAAVTLISALARRCAGFPPAPLSGTSSPSARMA